MLLSSSILPAGVCKAQFFSTSSLPHGEFPRNAMGQHMMQLQDKSNQLTSFGLWLQLQVIPCLFERGSAKP
jgi:hypothetical protein